MTDDQRQWAIQQLQTRAARLGRPPKKDDFDEPTRSRIKAFLGPWPRALEAARLKEPKRPAHAPSTTCQFTRKKEST